MSQLYEQVLALKVKAMNAPLGERNANRIESSGLSTFVLGIGDSLNGGEYWGYIYFTSYS
jgi:hypothetical protein